MYKRERRFVITMYIIQMILWLTVIVIACIHGSVSLTTYICSVICIIVLITSYFSSDYMTFRIAENRKTEEERATDTIAKISEVLMSDRTDEECIYLICELVGLEEEEE